MNSTNEEGDFFNRAHFVQGAQLLGAVFCMLGVIFAGLDQLRNGSIEFSAFAWLSLGAISCVTAAAAMRRVRSGISPLLAGCSLGVLYLGITWLLARTGG